MLPQYVFEKTLNLRNKQLIFADVETLVEKNQ